MTGVVEVSVTSVLHRRQKMGGRKRPPVCGSERQCECTLLRMSQQISVLRPN